MRRPSQLAQIVGSILVALAIAAVAIALVISHFGPVPAENDDPGGDHHGRSEDHSGPG